MIRHEHVWKALERIASANGYTMSGLAVKAGLDPTTFNRSKRFNQTTQRERWVSTHSVVKVLNLVGMSFEDFGKLVDQIGKEKGEHHADIRTAE